MSDRVFYNAVLDLLVGDLKSEGELATVLNFFTTC